MEFGDDYFIMFKIVEVKTDFVWKGGKASRRVDATTDMLHRSRRRDVPPYHHEETRRLYSPYLHI